ncbi:MAG TPA: PHB depolymerase family esterase [Aquaticitalea sp.]|nr:PHB depolymerase family esterase [Aquaticitalea sp.]
MKISFKYTFFIFCALMMFVTFKIPAQENLFSKEYFIQKEDTLKYRMLLPKDFSESESYPLVLFLHGAGERGDDNIKQLTHGSDMFVKYRDSFPAIVIFPQCPQTDYWANAMVNRGTKPLTLTFPKDVAATKALNMVMLLVDEMLLKTHINKEQVYVGGLSMGGMGTFEILYRKPDVFAGAFAICGAGLPETAEAYAKKVSMWIFHGANDDVVNPQFSVDMVGGILKYGGKPNFSLYAKDNHNSWDSAFDEPELLPWLFSNIKTKQ